MLIPFIITAAVCGSSAFHSHVSKGTIPSRGSSRAATPFIQCGPRVRIVSVGKTKEPWLVSAIDLYAKRLRPVLELDFVWVKDDAGLLSWTQKITAAQEGLIILDERGAQCTSVEFAGKVFDGLESGGSRLSIVIGGADGLPPSLKEDSRRLLSLSRMTFTHQMARLLLVEQIYRATEIRKGSDYHKD